MQNEKRYLSKPSSYYEYAMQQANLHGIANQTTLPEDFHLQIFWCRYIHYSSLARFKPNSKLHSHSFFELHCVLSGTMSYNVEGKLPTDISAGEFILIAPKQDHYMKSLTPDTETFAVTFEPICRDTEQGQRLATQFDAITNVTAPLPIAVYSLIEMIMQEFHDGGSFSIQNVKLLLNVLVIDLIQSIFNESVEKKNDPILKSDSIKDSRLIELERYINDNQSRFFSVAELADHLNISTRQLNNIIHGDLGISAKEFVDVSKSRQARKLLLETDYKLQKISEMLGFSDHNNFNRFFKRMEGLSPGCFRMSKGE